MRRDDRPSCTATAVVTAGSATIHDNQQRQPTTTTTIFFEVSRFPIQDTFTKPATYVVCIASVIKETYPFLPKECGNKLSRTTFPTVTLPLWLPPLFLFSFHCIAFRLVAYFSPPTFYGECASV